MIVEAYKLRAEQLPVRCVHCQYDLVEGQTVYGEKDDPVTVYCTMPCIQRHFLKHELKRIEEDQPA